MLIGQKGDEETNRGAWKGVFHAYYKPRFVQTQTSNL